LPVGLSRHVPQDTMVTYQGRLRRSEDALIMRRNKVCRRKHSLDSSVFVNRKGSRSGGWAIPVVFLRKSRGVFLEMALENNWLKEWEVCVCGSAREIARQSPEEQLCKQPSVCTIVLFVLTVMITPCCQIVCWNIKS